MDKLVTRSLNSLRHPRNTYKLNSAKEISLCYNPQPSAELPPKEKIGGHSLLSDLATSMTNMQG